MFLDNSSQAIQKNIATILSAFETYLQVIISRNGNFSLFFQENLVKSMEAKYLLFIIVLKVKERKYLKDCTLITISQHPQECYSMLPLDNFFVCWQYIPVKEISRE